MVGPHESSAFRERIQQRLDAAQETIEQQRGAMNHVMVELEQRETTFRQIADALHKNLLQPTLEAFADHFDNAQLADSGLTYFTKCELSHSIRFPATAHVAFLVTHDDSFEKLSVQYEAHILPMFIRYERTDALDQSLDNVDNEEIRQWAEEKLLGFLDSYLQIETHEQYQRDNVAVDPVCGMKVAKPKGLAHKHEGQIYYFCAQRCLDRFIESPNDFVHAMTN